MKKISILISIIIILFAVNISSANGIERLYAKHVTEDDTIKVSIMAKNVDNIKEIVLTFKYDKDVLTVKNVTKGKLTSNTIFSYNIDNNTGKIRITIKKSKGFSGNGSIASIEYKYIGIEKNSSRFKIVPMKIVDTNGDNITVSKISTSRYIGPPKTYVTIQEQQAIEQNISIEQNMSDQTKNTPGLGIVVSIITIVMISMIYILNKKRSNDIYIK